jgi:hypothetical protein
MAEGYMWTDFILISTRPGKMTFRGVTYFVPARPFQSQNS